jgi:hypothetical protein
MRTRQLFQSIEDRGVVAVAPILCDADDAWLGTGCYFWDSEIKDAHWWGQVHYHDYYVIYQSEYDYDSREYLDLLGNTDHRKYFFEFANALIKKRQKKYRVGEAIELLKQLDRTFLKHYKAVRALPETERTNVFQVYFDDKEDFYLPNRTRIQMCVIDTSFLLDGKYTPVYHSSDNMTVV